MKQYNKSETVVRGIAFLVISIGLMYCLATGQAETLAMEIGAGCVALLSFALGIWQCAKALHITGGR